jgi:hypothetical protein
LVGRSRANHHVWWGLRHAWPRCCCRTICASLASRGEAFLFGSIINELFASRVAMGSFTELTIHLRPSTAEYGWPPRNGRQILI